MEKNHITGIELSDKFIRLIQGNSSRSEIILSHDNIKAVESSLDIRTNALKEQIQQAPLAVKDPVLVISRRRAIIKYLSLPANNDVELRKLIKLRLVDIAVTSPDKVVWDYIQIGADSNGFAKVLIFVLNKEMVEQEIEVLSRNGLIPSELTLTSLAAHRWFVFQVGRLGKTVTHPVALINLNSDDGEICFVDQNYLYASYYINLGLNDLPAQSNSLMEQIHSTVSAYRKEGISEDISGFVITAGAEVLISELQKAYNLTVDIINPMDGIAKTDAGINLTRPGVAILGALFSDGLKSLNLMPDKVKGSKSLSWDKNTQNKLIILLSLAYILGVAAWSAGFLKKSVYLWYVQAQLAKTQPEIQKINEINRRIGVIKEESYGQFLIVDLMDKLSSITPEDLNYQSVQLDENKHLVLEGDANFESSVNKLQTQLVGSSYFSDVDLEFANKHQTPDGELTHFKISCQVYSKAGSLKGNSI